MATITIQPQGPFVVMINDAQRQLISRLIAHAQKDPAFVAQLHSEPSGEVWPDTNAQLAALLRTMLDDLPKKNEVSDDRAWGANGRIVHGFCI